MATFLRHESCPECGSRDNLGRYSDGGAFCFGCHYRERGDSRAVHSSDPVGDSIHLPDVSTSFSPAVVAWLAQYDISVPEALKWGWRYNTKDDQLIFPFYGQPNELLLYQARNFSRKPKYYNKGSVADVLPIFHSGRPSPALVVVEDCVSAAKIARINDAMPLLGSHLPATKLMRLKGLYKGLVLWLDSDKLKEAREMETMARFVGFDAKTIYTELDPKEYNVDEIKELLK